MAGEWIPMRLNLADDPAVIGIADSLGIDEFGVVGRLHRLWVWANQQLPNGDARGVTEKWIDRHVHTPGFAAALISVGWLAVGEAGVVFPKFDRWNSKGAKKRLLTAQRMKKLRDAPSVTEASPEKRREEKRVKDPPNPPQAGGSDSTEPVAVVIPAELDNPDFRAAWSEWKAERKAKRMKPYTSRGEQQQLAKLAPFGPEAAIAAIRESIAQGWQGLFPKAATARPAFETHDERVMREMGLS